MLNYTCWYGTIRRWSCTRKQIWFDTKNHLY